MATVFLRLLAHDDKPAALAQAIDRLRDGEPSPDVHVVDPGSFRQVPGSPFAYWLSGRFRRLFLELAPFESDGRLARQGGINGDDFRWLRLWTEVSLIESNVSCVPIAKGGQYSKFYSNLHLVALWDHEKHTFLGFTGLPHRPSERPASVNYYFRPGLTWSRRSQKGLTIRVMPKGCIFADRGPSIFVEKDDRLELIALLALVNSKILKTLVELQIAFGSFEVGVIQRTPIPRFAGTHGEEVGRYAMASVKLKQCLDYSVEISHAFHFPALLQVRDKTLAERITIWQNRIAHIDIQLEENQHKIDDIAFRLYGIDGEDRRSIEEGSGLNTASAEEVEDDDSDDEAGPTVEGKSLTAALLSYATGCVLGRWDIRFALGECPTPELSDPFDPLPICSPGMLQGDDGLPLKQAPEGYSLRIDWDGILVDDSSPETSVM